APKRLPSTTGAARTGSRLAVSRSRLLRRHVAKPTGAGLVRYEIAPEGSRSQAAAARADCRLQAREAPPEGVAKLVDRAGLERAVGQLLLLRPVEQVQEGSDLRVRPRRPPAGPPPVSLLQPNEVGALIDGERRLVLGREARELEVAVLVSFLDV